MTLLYRITGSKHLQSKKYFKIAARKDFWERYWKLTHTDNSKKEITRRYFTSNTRFSNKEFNETVKATNPEVVIWNHPFFNH